MSRVTFHGWKVPLPANPPYRRQEEKLRLQKGVDLALSIASTEWISKFRASFDAITTNTVIATLQPAPEPTRSPRPSWPAP